MPTETSLPAVPEENSESSGENSSPTTQDNPPSSEENSSPDISVPAGSSDNPAEPSSDVSTPSVTLIDTGDEIISVVE